MIESVDEGNASVRLRVHRIAPQIVPVLMSSVFLLRQWQGSWGSGKHVDLHPCHWSHPQPNDKKPKLSLLPTACDIKLTDGCDPTQRKPPKPKMNYATTTEKALGEAKRISYVCPWWGNGARGPVRSVRRRQKSYRVDDTWQTHRRWCHRMQPGVFYFYFLK